MTVAGIYLGTFIFQPLVGSGSAEAQMREHITRVSWFTLAGMLAGLWLDWYRGGIRNSQTIDVGDEETGSS